MQDRFSARSNAPGPGRGRDRYADLALAVYAEEAVRGRHVLVVGDSTSGLAEHVLELGARQATVADPDVVRARLADTHPTDVRVLPFEGGVLPLASSAFGVAFVPDLGAVDAPALVDELARLLSDDGVLVVAVGNPDAPRALGSERAAVPYYELYEMLCARFPAVRMLGQSPFVGWSVVDFGAADSESAVTLDASLVEIPEDPERFVALCSAGGVAMDPYVVVQAPMDEVLGGDDTATEIGAAPAAVAPDVVARAVADAVSRALEVERASREVERASREVERASREAERASRENEQASREVERASREVERASRADADAAAAAETEARLREAVEQARAELDAVRSERDRTRSELAGAELEVAAARAKTAELDAALLDVRARNLDLGGRLDELTEEIGARDDERDAQNAYAEDLERELEERSQAVAAARAEVTKRARETETTAARLSELSAKLEEREAALARAEDELGQLGRHLAAARSEIELLRAERNEDLSTDIDALERALRVRGEELRLLEVEVSRRDGLVRGLVAELAEARTIPTGLEELVEDVTVPLETAFEGPAEGVLRAGLSQAHAEVAEAHAARARIEAERAQEIDALTSELAQARERLVDAEARRTATAFRVDEVASELLVARAERDRANAELVASRAAEGEAQQAARRALEETRTLSEALDDVDEDRARVSGALLGALRRVAELEVERDARARVEDRAAIEREVETARFEARTLAAEVEALRGREAELVGRIRGLALRNRELSGEIDDAARRAARADEDAWTSMAARSHLTETASELEERCHRAEAERGAAHERIAELEEDVRTLRDRGDDAGMEIARMRAIEASLAERMLDLQQEVERSRRRVEELEMHEEALKIEAARLNALASSFQDRAEGLSQELEGTKRGYRARLSELSAELDRRVHRERIVAGEAKFLRERMQEWTERLEAGEREATKALDELASRSDQLGDLESALARANERAATLAGERDGLRLRMEDRAAAWAALRDQIARSTSVDPGRSAALGTVIAGLRGERDGLRLRLRDLGHSLASLRTNGSASIAAPAPSEPEAVEVPSSAPEREPAASDLEGALRRAGDDAATRELGTRELEERLANVTTALRRREAEQHEVEVLLEEERRSAAEVRANLTTLERAASDLKWYLGERDAKIRDLDEKLRSAQERARSCGEQLDQVASAAKETSAHLEARVRHLEAELSTTRGREAALDEQLVAQRERVADAERRATEAAQRASEGERRTRGTASAGGADESGPRDPQIAVLQREAGEHEVLLRSLAAQLEERDDRVRMLEQRLQQIERERRSALDDTASSTELRRLREAVAGARSRIEGLAAEARTEGSAPMADKLGEIVRLVGDL